MTLWEVQVDDEVQDILNAMPEKEADKAYEIINMLKQHGPHLERFSRGELAHSLKNSRYSNLKELIVKSGRSPWRFAYFIDKRQIVHILCGGDKRRATQSVFYRRLIARADAKIDAITRGQ